MSFINSANISLFPLAKDRTNDRSSNMLYEFNLANFINQISDVEGFLIDFEPHKDGEGNDLKEEDHFLINTEISNSISLELKAGCKFSFNIGGRFVEIEAPGDDINNNENENVVLWSGSGGSKDIYAHLYVSNTSKEVQGQDTSLDNNSEYNGLEFKDSSESSREDCTTYTLHMFNITDGELSIIEDSYRKFSARTLSPSFKFIDGKVD